MNKRHLLAVSALILEVALSVYTINDIQRVQAEDKSIGITCKGNKPCEQTVCANDKPCQKSILYMLDINRVFINYTW